jgi:hypothetical protein
LLSYSLVFARLHQYLSQEITEKGLKNTQLGIGNWPLACSAAVYIYGQHCLV